MIHHLSRWHHKVHLWRRLLPDELLALVLAVLIFIAPVASATRFETRGLLMQTTQPGVTTNYTISLHYASPDPVGSVDMLFCEDPIPYMPCVVPPGLDVSNAVLDSQTGETGFAISQQSTNHILLSRMPSAPTTSGQSSYVLKGVKNPTNTEQAFSIRMKSLGSTDGSGAQIDFGSVRGQVTNAITIEAQVPPMLIFCVAEQVDDNCFSTNDVYYHDMGTLSPSQTLVAQSQMAVGTNASQGFTITANGSPPSAGTHVITPPSSPTPSIPGSNQFGINLVENTLPSIGSNPEGSFTNAVAAAGYNIPNQYKYASGDVVAYSPNVSLIRKFTVSYIVNSNQDIHPGVYTTTLTYIASGRF